MLESKPRKRKLQRDDAEPEAKKNKLQMYQNSRPIIAESLKVNDISIKPNTCTALMKRECDGPMAMLCQTPNFKLNEIIWAKIRGHPAWPAKIVDFPSPKMALVVWYNDYRKTKVYRTQLFKFLINFDKFAGDFDKSIGLKTAAREALYCYGTSLE